MLSPPPLIYLSIYLDHQRLMDIYFVPWIIIQSYHYFCWSNDSSFGYQELFQHCSYSLLISQGFFKEFSYFLTLCDAPGSSHVFLGTARESLLSQGGPIPLFREFHPETKLWALGVLMPESLPLNPLSTQTLETYVFILTCTYTHTSIFISESVYAFKNYEFMLIPPIPIPTARCSCSPLPFLICNFFFMLGKRLAFYFLIYHFSIHLKLFQNCQLIPFY